MFDFESIKNNGYRYRFYADNMRFPVAGYLVDHDKNKIVITKKHNGLGLALEKGSIYRIEHSNKFYGGVIWEKKI